MSSLHCSLRLLRVQNAFCCLSSAAVTLKETKNLLQKAKAIRAVDVAALYREFAEFHFIRSLFNEVSAFQQLSNELSGNYTFQAKIADYSFYTFAKFM